MCVILQQVRHRIIAGDTDRAIQSLAPDLCPTTAGLPRDTGNLIRPLTHGRSFPVGPAGTRVGSAAETIGWVGAARWLLRFTSSAR
jgi:hypothetical protein